MKAIVLGAGVAGLSAARALVKAGWQVEVFEALPFVGGRVRTYRPSPALPPLELGADFLHGRHPELLKLLKRARIRLRDAEGEQLNVERGRIIASSQGDESYQRAMELLARMEHAPERTVEWYLSRHQRSDPSGTRIARRFVEGFYAASTRHAAPGPIGRMQRVAETFGGDSVYRIWQGYDAVPNQLASELERDPRARLRLGLPVREVHWSPGKIAVVAGETGATIRSEARVAIVALPLPMLNHRAFPREAPRFVPSLTAKSEALSKLTMGPVVKALLAFDRPVWEEGRAGRLKKMGMLHLSSAAFPVWWRPLPHPEPVLVGWAGGPQAAALGRLSAGGRLQEALQTLSNGLGLPNRRLENSLNLASTVSWADQPFIRGGYAVVAPGGDGAMSKLSEPLNKTLFFAGEATEPDLAGTVHGALVSGLRAAGEAVRL